MSCDCHTASEASDVSVETELEPMPKHAYFWAIPHSSEHRF